MTPERINWINETLARRDGWIQESSGEWVLYSATHRDAPLMWKPNVPTYHDNADNLRRVMRGMSEEKWLELIELLDLHAPVPPDCDSMADREVWWAMHYTRHLEYLASIVADVIGGDDEFR